VSDRTPDRRRFLSAAAGSLALPFAAPAQKKDGLPVTGRANPALKSFDELLTAFVKKHEVPGAAVAVTRDGRLVYARGFGHADVEKGEAVKPHALFRIASVSKPLTAVAVLHLVEKGKLMLDDRPFVTLGLRPLFEKKGKEDPRLKDVTVLKLLQHTDGFDRDVSFDPMFRSVQIARAFGAEPPATQTQIIRYVMGRPLDFAPGERYAYSNFGYCVLGRVIEKASGQSYEAFVRKEILAPLGVHDAKLGRTLRENRAPGEVVYYDEKQRTGPAVMGKELGKPVPLPYGAWCLEAMDAHGGWIASAPDLVRFAAAFDHPQRCKVLKEKSIAAMFARPAGAAGTDGKGKPKDAYYGCGWSVRPVGNTGKANAWHTGALDGTGTLLVRRFDGLNWAVLFNSRKSPAGVDLVGEIDGKMHEAADAVAKWPEYNLFEKSGK
jgi:CubicO group peptidase (beta-lactamase class C family)